MLLDLLLRAIWLIAAGAFLLGLGLTAATGSARVIKLLLASITGVLLLLLVVGFVVTRGLLIYLTFQLIALVVMWYLALVAGAVCGGGIYLLLHRKRVGKALTAAMLPDYLPLPEFCARESIEEARALARIKSGFYSGGSFEGTWYVSKSELSAASNDP